MKCSFCEQVLVCKACRQPVPSTRSETLLGLYQPDSTVTCPQCHKVLVCKVCGFVYSQEDKDEASSQDGGQE